MNEKIKEEMLLEKKAKEEGNYDRRWYLRERLEELYKIKKVEKLPLFQFKYQKSQYYLQFLRDSFVVYRDYQDALKYKKEDTSKFLEEIRLRKIVKYNQNKHFMTNKAYEFRTLYEMMVIFPLNTEDTINNYLKVVSDYIYNNVLIKECNSHSLYPDFRTREIVKNANSTLIKMGGYINRKTFDAFDPFVKIEYDNGITNVTAYPQVVYGFTQFKRHSVSPDLAIFFDLEDIGIYSAKHLNTGKSVSIDFENENIKPVNIRYIQSEGYDKETARGKLDELLEHIPFEIFNKYIKTQKTFSNKKKNINKNLGKQLDISITYDHSHEIANTKGGKHSISIFLEIGGMVFEVYQEGTGNYYVAMSTLLGDLEMYHNSIEELGNSISDHLDHFLTINEFEYIDLNESTDTEDI